MTSIALARKWRPRTFEQLLGQEHVTTALTHAIKHQRLHHAYLFTGTRGIGKTSVARLLAKALNCEQDPHVEPCLACDTCLAIEQGRYIDLIEIDGASNTRVEDTRSLLDNVSYAPTLGRFKIYLIDEVHMLSQHSFNALLKTLEEPPEHVKFILATTDPHKLPLTILSRCLQFHLKPLSIEQISQHLAFILQEEKIIYEQAALPLIAQSAEGSMRDALSLLDQCIITGQGELHLDDVTRCLGLTQQHYAQLLLQALALRQPNTLFTLCQQIHEEGANYQYILDDILRDLHQVSILHVLPQNNARLNPSAEQLDLCSHFSAEDTQLLYQIALKGSADLSLAPTTAIGFEMTLLRMHTFMPVTQKPSIKLTPTISAPISILTSPSLLEKSTPVPIITPSNSPILTPTATSTHDLSWHEVIPKLKLSGIALAGLENTEQLTHTQGQLTLRVSKAHHSLFSPSIIKKIEQQLTDYYQEPTRLTLEESNGALTTLAQHKTTLSQAEQAEATAALETDSFFQSLQQTFSAEIVPNSIASRKDSL